MYSTLHDLCRNNSKNTQKFIGRPSLKYLKIYKQRIKNVQTFFKAAVYFKT